MNYVFPELRLPKRWGRAKRKTIRAVVRAAQLRAAVWAEITKRLKEHLDKTWGDPPPTIDWGACGFTATASEPFIDDAESG